MRLGWSVLTLSVALAASMSAPNAASQDRGSNGAAAGKAASKGKGASAATGKAEASKEFRAGVAAFKKNSYGEAADHFEKAYEISPHPSVLWNAADAREKAGELSKAANLYTRYLEIAPEKEKDRAEAQQRLNRLSSTLARIEIANTDARDVTVDRVAINGSSVFVDPGDHVVSGSVNGEIISKNVQATAGSRQKVRLVKEAAPAVAASASAETPSSPATASVSTDSPGFLTSPWMVYIGAGVTAALAGVTVWSGMDTKTRRSDFDANPTRAGYDDGMAAQTRTNILLGATGAVGIATAVFGVFVVNWSGKSENPKEPQVGLMPGGVSVQMRF